MPGRAPLDIVRCPAGVVRDHSGIVCGPTDFTRMKQIFTCNDAIIYIKIRHYSSKENMLTLTVMEVKTTLVQDCKNVNSTCSWHVIRPQLLKQSIYFCIYIFGLQK